MTRRGAMQLLASGVAFAAFAGCALNSRTYRYRLTVEVDTPQGLRWGSSVIEVTTSLGRDPTGLLPWTEVSTDVRGEAVAVDLPGGRTLFALLCSDDGRVDAAGGYALGAFPSNPPNEGKDAYAKDVDAMMKRRDIGVLPRTAYPMLVTFRDPLNQKSVERVDPDNLIKNFGPGIVLRRIAAQVTHDPVTIGIDKRLKWLNKKEQPDPEFHPEHIPVGDYKRLFSTEVGS